MKLYHSTSTGRADAIDQTGFRDSAMGELVGVWLGPEAGQYGTEAIFEIDVPDDVAASYRVEYESDEPVDPSEWTPDEWFVPAAVLNTLPRHRFTDDEIDAVWAARHAQQPKEPS